MKEKTREYMKIIIIIFALLGVVLYLNQVILLLGIFLHLIFPLIAGLLIAFVLNVPVRGIENLMEKADSKQRIKKRFKRNVSILLTFMIILVIMILTIRLFVPNMISAAISLSGLVQTRLPELIDSLQGKYNLNLEQLQTFLNTMNINNMISRAFTMLSGMSAAVSSTFSTLFDLGIALIIAVYVLSGKEKLGRQMMDFLRAFLSEKAFHRMMHVAGLVSDTYSGFLTGQCLEALIISVLITGALWIFRIPYAFMIGILSGVLSFIPYIGSLVACFGGAFFILMINPWQALLEIIIFQVVQFVEGQMIYPRVVGKSVGLPPLFTLVGALLGGKLFGLVGMIFFIPVVAVIYNLIREATYNRLK